MTFLSGSVYLLLTIYLAGCIAMVFIFLRQILLCRRWLAEAMPVKSEEVLTLFEACRQKMNVKTWLVVSESPAVSGPFLIGAIRPTLLLPQGMIASATERQLRTVFLHELAHLKRWDVWIGWLATFMLITHWFNPMLWLAIRKMNADREEACDALALKTLNQSDRADYAHSLLDILERFTVKSGGRKPAGIPGPGLVGISETGKLLHRRIDMINQNRTWKLRWQILALLAAMLIGAATLTDAQERRPVAEIQADIEERRQAIAEMRVDIGKLQAELLETKVAEGIELDEDDLTVVFYPAPSKEHRSLFSAALGNLARNSSSPMEVTLGLESNMYAIIGTKADHDKVREMFAQLEKAQAAKELDEETRRFFPIISEEHFEQITNILQDLSRDAWSEHLLKVVEIRRVGTRISLAGRKAEVDMIWEILASTEKAQAMGEEQTAEQIIGIYSLDGVPRTRALRYLSSLIGVQVVLDDESNRIIVKGTKVGHENVQELLAQSTREAVAAAEETERHPLMPIQQRLEEMRASIFTAQNPVIPAQAGIQTEGMNPVPLDPRLRGGDGTDEEKRIMLMALNNFSMELARREEYKLALSVLDQGIAIDSTYAPFRANQQFVFYRWISSLAKAGQFDEARRVYALSEERLPGDKELRELIDNVNRAEAGGLPLPTEPQVERYSAQLAGGTAYQRGNPEVALRSTSGSLRSVGPEYLALLQKRVEVAKLEFDTMVSANERVPGTYPTIDVAKAELALLEAEFMFKQAQPQRAGDEGE